MGKRPAREFDLQPDPRILPMLGEINLEQWRCIAELVDNAIDSFLSAARSGMPVHAPEVHVQIPTSDAPNARITVRDNGPGMDPETLEKAVRAGWTGNDPISNLGLFGMGFNIATARLGTVTQVWTTLHGEPEWHGVEIDFSKLTRQKHFKTPMLSRPKPDSHQHGTEVCIEKVKDEQRLWLSHAANQAKIRKELARVYSAMLRPSGAPISFQLKVNRTSIRGRNHCVWGGEGNSERSVSSSKYGNISAYQPLDMNLPERLFCNACWQWLPPSARACPACGSSHGVVKRPRRIYGWIGLQRYLSANDYGIDFLRHGRKIEIANRDLFFWNDDGAQEEEYPIDDPRHRGRIVGEIHLDHCRVTYTKNRFDRDDPAWADMVRVVRGDGPIRPDKAEQLGFGPNTSPLSLLFQAFRRSSPKPKVAGCYARLLVVPDNDRAEEMARKFYAEEPEFQTDAKWWELVEEADRQLLADEHGEGSDETEGLDSFGEAETTGGGTNEQDDNQPEVEPTRRISIASLSRDYIHSRTGLRWEVKAYDVEPLDPDLGGEDAPWRLRKTASSGDEFLVNTAHSVFRSATMTPLDALLAELAWYVTDFVRTRPADGGSTFASVLAELRQHYAGTTELDPVALSNEAASTLNAIARSISRHVDPNDSIALFNELSPTEQEAVHAKMARRAERNPQQAISGGRFLEFALPKTLLRFFQGHPELFFDGRYWDAAYADLEYGSTAATEEAQAVVMEYYSSMLTDAIWLAEQDPNDLAQASRPRLLRAALALELLSSNVRAESDV